MKDSKIYSEKVQKVFRSLKRKHGKQTRSEYEDPVDAVIYAVISEDLTEKQTEQTLKKIKKNFVNINDLRVALVQEITETIRADDEKTALHIAARLKAILQAVFKKYNVVTLAPLNRMGKRFSRKILDNLNGTSEYVADYCTLTALNGHAVPVNATMLKYLRENELVHPKSDDADIRGFLTRLVNAKDAYQFYALLRAESERQQSKPAKKRTVKKTKKAKKTKNTKEKTTQKAAKKKKPAKKKTKKTTNKKAKKKTKAKASK